MRVRDSELAEKSAKRFSDALFAVSVIDVVAALADTVNPRDYWFRMKVRVRTEDGFGLSTTCRQFKMKASEVLRT